MTELLVDGHRDTETERHPKIISQARKYGRSLTEQQQEARGSKLLGPVEVDPKVLQGFWLPPPNTGSTGTTKAAQEQVTAALSTTLLPSEARCS
ncbi:hypothetical protein Q5P01_023785 [Channa striata]|uniref:Uncharacterized protein n=1 Tax=Channa striata TaxID=64152 RepID=A0AA88ITQ1_CHASR|nr:hypothetical protein Q5P01_023785 [Channa striata]